MVPWKRHRLDRPDRSKRWPSQRYSQAALLKSRVAGGDVAVDGHGGDAAGLGDFGHGELAGVVHALGLVDEGWGHRGFAAAGAAAGAGGEQAGMAEYEAALITERTQATVCQ